jgi:hypothetical protein
VEAGVQAVEAHRLVASEGESRRRCRFGSIVAALGIAILGAGAMGAAITADAVPSGDRLEPGKQGETMPGEAILLPQPYSKGVRVVGQVGGIGDKMMAFAGHCAYSAGKSGVTVIDVKDPRAPKVLGLLSEKGAIGANETLNAAGGVLAASVYGIAGPKKWYLPGQSGNGHDAWLAAYDVSDCAHPKLMLEYMWPERVHTLTVSPNAKRIYGTVISPWTGHGGLQVLDISDPAHAHFLGKLPITRPDGTSYEWAPHEVSLSPDEKRIYAGVISSRGGDLNRTIQTGKMSAEALGPEAGGMYIIDNTDIATGKPDPKLRVIGTAEHAGWHSAMQARIKGVPYLVGAGEVMACPGAWPRLTNVADERHPSVVSQFRLQMNMKENCPPPEGIEITSRGMLGRPGTASSHFEDVDSPTDTRLGLFGMTWAGLRIADLREPATPVEVAYFKPGLSCATHFRYMSGTGQIWFGCGQNFYVIELRPELRASLGLPKAPRRSRCCTIAHKCSW